MTLEKVPARHLEHTDSPVVDPNVPTGHAVPKLKPEALQNAPAEQSAHFALLGCAAYDPTGQAIHADWFVWPVRLLNVPTPHARQADCPDTPL